eukprot:452525_1
MATSFTLQKLYAFMIIIVLLGVVVLAIIYQTSITDVIVFHSHLLSYNHSNVSSNNTKSLDMHSLITQRTTKPSPCNTSKHKISMIKPETHNWAPYFHRCNFHRNIEPEISIGQGWFTKQLSYVHIYKAGGSTIDLGLSKLAKANQLINLTAYNLAHSRKQGHHYKAFYEINRRVILANNRRRHWLKSRKYAGKNAIEKLRILMQDILTPKTNKSSDEANWMFDYKDIHASPNILFLRKQIPFNFIGNLRNLEFDLPQILQNFVDEELVRNRSVFTNWFSHERNRDNSHYITKQTRPYVIYRSDLNDSDVEMICKIYWLDYICFPFEIPKQCNISYLFEQHYNKHVSYNSCY